MYTPMTREQRRLVETMRSTTLEFAALARSRDEFGGGMQWLKVKKFEYLTRYRRDPVTGEQKAASIGRRSPETEAIYDRFIKERAELDRQISALRPTIAEQTRMARALRLSRAPEEVGAVARAIGLSELIDHITIIGEAAVYAYECEMAALLPREMLPDDGMDLLVAGVHPTDVVDELLAVLRRAKIYVRLAHLSEDLAVAELRTEEGLSIRLYTMSTLGGLIDRYAESSAYGAEAVRWALDLPVMHSMLVDRNGRAATVAVLEPRAYCLLRFVALDVEEMSLIRREASAELNATMVKLVHERWTEPFIEDHVQTIGPLHDLLGEDGFPSAPRM
ncbi:GSU2403 family nucleotidyltransferase fold protein [Bradyrhizobium sp. Arg816]|uniref:GSU2403 family nucleotidyltransferase fold protein n=1 Tax=Bradyrhizobium sp. Arg816 TaxID=2998491 RepID=UPI00249EE14F|nr:GSU2403 family nucleotidyltransferase fold protein [Bradyrhizobium sp. Arg816]MDI3559850.1 GSU2403 family nucleotidyltransferase fold protein [Bradyrhizobium sp. Arg816]